MLEETTRRIADLPLQTKATIERMAFATQVAQLREDLIPQERAVQIVEEHKQAETEEWKRAIAGALAAFEAQGH